MKKKEGETLGEHREMLAKCDEQNDSNLYNFFLFLFFISSFSITSIESLDRSMDIFDIQEIRTKKNDQFNRAAADTLDIEQKIRRRQR